MADENSLTKLIEERRKFTKENGTTNELMAQLGTTLAKLHDPDAPVKTYDLVTATRAPASSNGKNLEEKGLIKNKKEWETFKVKTNKLEIPNLLAWIFYELDQSLPISPQPHSRMTAEAYNKEAKSCKNNLNKAKNRLETLKAYGLNGLEGLITEIENVRIPETIPDHLKKLSADEEAEQIHQWWISAVISAFLSTADYNPTPSKGTKEWAVFNHLAKALGWTRGGDTLNRAIDNFNAKTYFDP